MSEVKAGPSRNSEEKADPVELAGRIQDWQHEAPGGKRIPTWNRALYLKDHEWDAIQAALRASVASETEKQISPRTFDQIRDGIVSRMRGHTISRGDWSAYCNFMGLLAKVKESECFADAFFAGGERPREAPDCMCRQGERCEKWCKRKQAAK